MLHSRCGSGCRQEQVMVVQCDMDANGGLQSIVGDTQDASPEALEHSEASSDSSKTQWFRADLRHWWCFTVVGFFDI